MTAIVFVLSLAGILAVVLWWSFRHLAGERWQMLACIPRQKDAGQSGWASTNLTYYGFFCATGATIALAVFVMMLGALGIHAGAIVVIAGTVLAAGTAAARIVARLVEKKAYTFSVAGASFVGFLLLPFVLGGARAVLPAAWTARAELTAVVAAVVVAYGFGEGIGRLACLSFGCCYGKPIADLPARLQRWAAPLAVRFHGATKKIAYAANREGVAVVPVQALSAIVNLVAALAGLYLFLEGAIAAALLVSASLVFGWRFASEWLRDDDRGGGRITAYQWMCVLLLALCAVVPALAPAGPAAPDLQAGFGVLWHPGMILTLQAVWVLLFLRFGVSSVTYATTTFHLHSHRL